MSVDAGEPEEEEGREDEFLTDDDTPVSDVPPEQKKIGRPKGMSREESAKLSATIWEEYAGGMNAQQIADVHGMTREGVWWRIRKLRTKLGIETIEEAKALDLGRYEAIIEKVWTTTFKDPTPENVRSLAMLMDQRAKLLGLNAPRKLQVDGRMELTPSPAFVHHLDRIVREREAVTGDIDRIGIEAPAADIVDAEVIDDDD